LLRGLAIAVPILLVLGYGGASLYVYDQLSHAEAKCAQVSEPGELDTFEIEGVDTERYHVSEFETVSFPSHDAPEVTIAATWVPSSVADDTPAIIVVHGHNSCRHHPDALLAGGMLHRAGFAALLIDLRDHGDSTVEDGRFAGGTDEQLDVRGAVDWLESRATPPRSIAVMGYSLGAATATIAFGEDQRIAALWEDSSFGDVSEAIRDELSRNGYPTILMFGGIMAGRIISSDDFKAFSPLEEIGKHDGRPVFITHGDADERLSVRFAGELAARVRETGGTVEPWIVPGSGHTQADETHPDEYEHRLAAFFASALGAP
ncbi:MAG: alpha/beta fold hydrolase, partial [Chloroflexi bacterium]|nr:alpha/beta fold hydrolase [Chloroflexota bacterium]